MVSNPQMSNVMMGTPNPATDAQLTARQLKQVSIADLSPHRTAKIKKAPALASEIMQ